MKRPLVITALVLALGSCTNENVRGRVSFSLYDCDLAANAECAKTSPEKILVPAVISAKVARKHNGVYILAQPLRTSGVTAMLEMDVAEGQTPTVSYSEWTRAGRSFNGEAAGGTVVLQGEGRARGRFALRFIDPGPDGVRGTADDAVRFLADGQYHLATRAAAAVAADPTLGVDSDEDDSDILVEILDSIDLDSAEDTGSDDSSGSGTSDDSSSSTDSSGASGCGGDSGDDSAETSGCGGDTGGDSTETSGCSGGGSSDTSGCSGCSGDARFAQPGKKSAGRSRGVAALFPLFAVAFIQGVRRPRNKKAWRERKW